MHVPDSNHNRRLRIIANNPIRVINAISEKYYKDIHTYDCDFAEAIYENLTLEEAKLLLATLSKCTCCDRHQKHRPSSLDDFDCCQQACGDHHEDDQQCCQCPCRHFSRWICRTFQEIDTDNDA